MNSSASRCHLYALVMVLMMVQLKLCQQNLLIQGDVERVSETRAEGQMPDLRESGQNVKNDGDENSDSSNKDKRVYSLSQASSQATKSQAGRNQFGSEQYNLKHMDLFEQSLKISADVNGEVPKPTNQRKQNRIRLTEVIVVILQILSFSTVFFLRVIAKKPVIRPDQEQRHVQMVEQNEKEIQSNPSE